MHYIWRNIKNWFFLLLLLLAAATVWLFLCRQILSGYVTTETPHLQFDQQLIVLFQKFLAFILIVSDLQEVRIGFSQLQLDQLATLQSHTHTHIYIWIDTETTKPRPCLHRDETLHLRVYFLWMTWTVNTSRPSPQCNLCIYSLYLKYLCTSKSRGRNLEFGI